MTTLRLYAHLITPPEQRIEFRMAWKAMDVCERVAQHLAKLYNGKITCSSAGTVQYSDIVYLDVSEACIQSILRDFPFIRVLHKYSIP